jgi:hypothetical protein
VAEQPNDMRERLAKAASYGSGVFGTLADEERWMIRDALQATYAPDGWPTLRPLARISEVLPSPSHEGILEKA